MGQSLLDQVSGQGFPTDSIKMFSNLPSSVCIVLSGPADRAFVSCYSTTDAFTTRDLREQVENSVQVSRDTMLRVTRGDQCDGWASRFALGSPPGRMHSFSFRRIL